MKYDFDINLSINNAHSLILERITPSSKVLEFGPATGYMTQFMKEKLDCTIYCVEIDEEAANFAKQYTEKMIVADVDSLIWLSELAGEKFDHIIFADVLEHLRDPWKVLENAATLLNINGTMLTSIPNIGHNAVLMELLEGKFQYRNLGLLDNTHVRFFTKQSVLDLLDITGLSPVEWLATYMVPEQTEINQTYSSFPKAVQSYLKSRTEGHVYQFVTVSKRKQDISLTEITQYNTNKNLLYHKSLQLFWEHDGSFSEEFSKNLPLTISDQFVEYNFILPSDVGSRLRIDPSNLIGYFEIESIILFENDPDHDSLNNYLVIWSANNNFSNIIFENVKRMDQNLFKFACLTEDPQFIISGLPERNNDSIWHLRVVMKFKKNNLELILDYENVLLQKENDLAAIKNEMLVKDEIIRSKDSEIFQHIQLNSTILNSTSWKLTSPLRKLGQILRKLKRILKARKANYEIKRNSKKKIDLRNKLNNRPFVMIFSHTNYLHSMGGTEKYIYEQNQNLKQQNISTIQVFPGKLYSFLNNEESYYGVNLNEEFQGYYSSKQLVEFIEQNNIMIQSAFIHHLLNWQYSDYHIIHEKLTEYNIKKIFYLHDFFSSCSSCHMIFKNENHQKPCIPEMKENSKEVTCSKCHYSKDLEQWRSNFQFIFKSVEFIVAPSEYVSSGFKIIYPEFFDKVMIWGHLKLIECDEPKFTPFNAQSKIKLAYLGYKMHNKGWETWERIFRNEALNEIYEFHHLGSSENYAKNVLTSEYSFIDNGLMGAVKLLEDKKINIVLLWSIVPESYSYTLYEAIAAGVPVLTNVRSGNIADTIHGDKSLGNIFTNEKELVVFLLNQMEVLNLISLKRKRFNLEFNPLPFI